VICVSAVHFLSQSRYNFKRLPKDHPKTTSPQVSELNLGNCRCADVGSHHARRYEAGTQCCCIDDQNRKSPVTSQLGSSKQISPSIPRCCGIWARKYKIQCWSPGDRGSSSPNFSEILQQNENLFRRARNRPFFEVTSPDCVSLGSLSPGTAATIRARKPHL
jgi:hypothetical protein